MKRHLIHLLLVAVLSLVSTVAFSQITVKGQLVDAETNEPLIGVAVVVEGTTQGTVSDIDGNFRQQVAPNATLVFKYVGYNELRKKITHKGNVVNLGVLQMKTNSVMLKDVTITSNVAVARKTPVAVSSIDPVFIEEKLGTKEFPEILKSTPGVHSTKGGGGFGDSKTVIRGFKQENVAVMINGVPMNDMENNRVYWSNWAGLSDVTRTMQVQRGLGASKVASPAVGGSINIITKSTEAKKGGALSYGVGNDGYNKMLFTVSSGLSKEGWAFTLLGAKSWGDGYVQGTNFESYNYFLSIAKRFNDNQQLSFTIFGAPQTHFQRNGKMTIKEWQKVKKYMNDDKSPYQYNSTYGFDENGKSMTSAYNVYHKPQISLNHLWQINQKSSLSTALYMSIGRGYGYRGDGQSAYRNDWYGTSRDGILNMKYRKGDGTFDYGKIQAMNEQSLDGSKMIVAKGLNNHMWYGLLSTYTTKLGSNFDFYGGIDFRYYKGLHQNKIVNLMNGQYFVDTNRKFVNAANNAAAAIPGYATQKLGVGDVIYRDYDGMVMSEGIFSQLEYNKDRLSAFVSGAITNAGYWRYDRMYYDKDHAKSDTYNYLGFNLKGGVNYNLTDHHNVFVNAGYISRPPIYNSVFISSQNSHVQNPDARNEKIASFELGYGYKSKYLLANVNAYFTKWNDKSMAKSREFAYLDDNKNLVRDRWFMNMTGVNARHMGLEFDLQAKPLQWLDLTAMFSIGDWIWDSKATGYYFDTAGRPIKLTDAGSVKDATGAKVNISNVTYATEVGGPDHGKTTVELDKIPVGGAAQTTAALGVNVRPMKGLRLGLEWNFYARDYADYTIDAGNMGAEVKVNEPWRIPSYSTFDLSAGYSFDFGKVRAHLSGNVDNLFDQEYISDADDFGGTWDKAAVYYGFGRTYSVRLKFSF